MTAREIDVMARTIWGEARGEPFVGKLAVGYVIVNRADRPRWPNDIIGVCVQRKQFSAWLAGDPNLPKLLKVDLDDPVLQECYLAALGVATGRFPDPTGGADHYHADSISPGWAKHMTETARHGGHIFYAA